MSLLTQNPLSIAYSVWSDMYKEVYGVRPRGTDTSNWTLNDFNVQCEALQQRIDSINQIHQQEAAAIDRFEKQVAATISIGARDRETALRWIMEASGCAGDWGYLADANGLPYDYFSK